MHWFKKQLAVLFVTAVACVPGTTAWSMPASDGNSVAILKSTTGFADPSLEASKAAALGYTVVEFTDAQWMAATQADFETYRAIVIGDPTCQGFGYPGWLVAESTRAVWGPAVTGNVIVVGSDPTFHSSFGFAGPPGPDGDQVAESGIAFAAAEAGETGAYITTSCVYHDASPGTPVPLLDQFGSFTATGVGCYNDAHIVAVHPALSGLTDASLSNWFCSVHNAFDSFPGTFIPLAIAQGITGPGSITFADGSVGIPYVLARGKELTPILCGNGILEAPEQCDDGNIISGDGCSAKCEIEEDPAPDCSGASADPHLLWPPNHKMVPIGIKGLASDLVVTATSVQQDEPVLTKGGGAGKTAPDAILDPLQVRRERNGTGNSRVYVISFSATNPDTGKSCTGEVKVCVEHDQGGNPDCAQDSPLYDSTEE